MRRRSPSPASPLAGDGREPLAAPDRRGVARASVTCRRSGPITLETLSVELARADSALFSARLTGALLIVLRTGDARGSACSSSPISCSKRLVPTVMLLPAVDAHARGLQSGGRIIESWDAQPAFLADVPLRPGVSASPPSMTSHATWPSPPATRVASAARWTSIHDELHLAAAVQQEMLPAALPAGKGFVPVRRALPPPPGT
jgi:hypothetical protein